MQWSFTRTCSTTLIFPLKTSTVSKSSKSAQAPTSSSVKQVTESSCVRMWRREASTFQRWTGLSNTTPQMIPMITSTEWAGRVVVLTVAAKLCSSFCSTRLVSSASSNRRRWSQMSLNSPSTNWPTFKISSWSSSTRITTWTLLRRMPTAATCSHMPLIRNVISSTWTCSTWLLLLSRSDWVHPPELACTSRLAAHKRGKVN